MSKKARISSSSVKTAIRKSFLRGVDSGFSSPVFVFRTYYIPLTTRADNVRTIRNSSDGISGDLERIGSDFKRAMRRYGEAN
jgi:hypothetical protein